MPKKYLVAFDFDHTLVDGNSDTIVRQLLDTRPPVTILSMIGMRINSYFVCRNVKIIFSSGMQTIRMLDIIHATHIQAITGARDR